MGEKVLITREKLDNLADTINSVSGGTTRLTLDGMTDAIENMGPSSDSNFIVTYTPSGAYLETETPFGDILSAYSEGKNIIAHIPALNFVLNLVAIDSTNVVYTITSNALGTLIVATVVHTKGENDNPDTIEIYTKNVTDALIEKADASTVYTKTEVDAALSNKQDTLVSQSNIKSVNGQSILGNGNLTVGDASIFYVPYTKVDDDTYSCDIPFSNIETAYRNGDVVVARIIGLLPLTIIAEITGYSENGLIVYTFASYDMSLMLVHEANGTIYLQQTMYSDFVAASDLSAEETARRTADNNLQGQIDAITVSSDVIDVVGTYADLQNYDTTSVKANDIVKVLQDSTHNDALSYYRWVITEDVGAWVYVGSEGPFYTKSETNTLLNAKADASALSDYATTTAMNTALATKQNALTAGNGIAIANDVISSNLITEIDNASATRIDVSSLNRGIYCVKPSNHFAYFSIPKADGTSENYSLANGGLLCKTANRVIFLGAISKVYAFDTTNDTYSDAQPIVELVHHINDTEGEGYIDAELNTGYRYVVDDELEALSITINFTEGHTSIVFTVETGYTNFYFSISDISGGSNFLFANGSIPTWEAGKTYECDIQDNRVAIVPFSAIPVTLSSVSTPE